MLATDLAKFVYWLVLLYTRGNFCSVMHRFVEFLNNHPGSDAYLNAIISYQSRVHDNNSLVRGPSEPGMLLV